MYLHLLVAHFPSQIRMYGDMRVRQTQGLEHCHAIRKEIGRKATNRKKGQRLLTMLTHHVVRCTVRHQRSKHDRKLQDTRNKSHKLTRGLAKAKRFKEDAKLAADDAVSSAGAVDPVTRSAEAFRLLLQAKYCSAK